MLGQDFHLLISQAQALISELLGHFLSGASTIKHPLHCAHSAMHMHVQGTAPPRIAQRGYRNHVQE